MELRHLRYFVAVVEEGSLTVAAERRLHTAQPSLSRQIRDLEYEVGAPLLLRSVRGVEMTAAGTAFLEHARLALAAADAAVEAARRAVHPARPKFALGFLTGQEMDWLPRAMTLLKDDLANIDVTVTSQYSPQLAEGLSRGRIDLAFLRPEANTPQLEYRLIARERLLVVLPSDHRLTSKQAIDIHDIRPEVFIGMSKTAPALQAVIEAYLTRSGVAMKATHEVDNLSMAISLVASTRGVALLPEYAQNFLPWSVTSRPLEGAPASIDLVIGYNKANTSTILKGFLDRSDALISEATPASPDG